MVWIEGSVLGRRNLNGCERFAFRYFFFFSFGVSNDGMI